MTTAVQNACQKSAFGESPTNWPVDRIRDRLGAIIGGEWGDDPEAHDEGVEIPVIRVADIRGLDVLTEGLTIRRVKHSKLQGRLIGKRTLLLEKSGGGENAPVGRAVLGRNIDFVAICSNFMAKTDCGPTVSPLFTGYLLSAAYSCGLNAPHVQQTTGIQNLRVFDYLNTHVALPPLPEQERIAAYLDASCAAIDTAVAAKRRQLETLDALRKSIIQKAVTKGLNLGTVMRYSGSDGLGEIPSHWRTDRMKDVVALRNEKTDVPSEESDYLELEDMESGTGRILNRRNTLEVESAVTLFQKGDVLFGKLRPYLEKYFHADFDGKCTGEILAFKSTRVYSRFLFYCIASPWFIERCNALAYGAKMPRVNWQTQLAVFILPLPPAAEQEAICAFLDTKLSELARIVGSIESQIATLTAYRKSLIHECVTGQRRITEVDVLPIRQAQDRLTQNKQEAT